MTILFALLVLLLLTVGLLNRKKSKKEWIKEERYEESGNWLDKRSGERGTYGSLDKEMEANRLYISSQRKIKDTTQAVQKILFAQHHNYQNLSLEKQQIHYSYCKSEIGGLFDLIESLQHGKTLSGEAPLLPPDTLRTLLKKQILTDSFEAFPNLLDLEIEEIRKLDATVDQIAERILVKISAD